MVSLYLMCGIAAEGWEQGASTLVHLPLAFVRSGWIRVLDGTTVGNGSWLTNRARTAGSLAGAYSLAATSIEVYPSNGGSHFVGHPLRCLTVFSLHEALDWVEAAEGETVPTMTEIRQTDICRAKAQMIGTRDRAKSARPAVAAVTNTRYSTSVNVHPSATDKS